MESGYLSRLYRCWTPSAELDRFCICVNFSPLVGWVHMKSYRAGLPASRWWCRLNYSGQTGAAEVLRPLRMVGASNWLEHHLLSVILWFSPRHTASQFSWQNGQRVKESSHDWHFRQACRGEARNQHERPECQVVRLFWFHIVPSYVSMGFVAYRWQRKGSSIPCPNRNLSGFAVCSSGIGPRALAVRIVQEFQSFMSHPCHHAVFSFTGGGKRRPFSAEELPIGQS